MFPFLQLKGAVLTTKVPFLLRLQAQPPEHTRAIITETGFCHIVLEQAGRSQTQEMPATRFKTHFDMN